VAAVAACWPAVATAQVMSVQPTSGLGGTDFAASNRIQFGTADLLEYVLGQAPGQQITSSQTGVVAGIAGGKALAVNPLPWPTLPPNATFRLQYFAATGRLTLSIRDGAGAIIQQQFINVNFANAAGINLNFAGLGAATFGGLSVTSGATTAAIGPSGNWSGTALASSTLTGWNFNANWQINGSFQFPAAGGTGALPNLQLDVLNQGLAYQMSDQGTGAPAVVNYGRIQDMVVTAAEFQQAQFGGTDGVLETEIYSRAAVTFNIAAGSSVELSGGVFDLQGVPNVEAADFGDASFVKNGDGTLILSGTSDYSGTMRLNAGRVILQDASGIGAGGLEIGDARLTLDTAVAFGATLPVTVLGDATIDSDVLRSASVSSTIAGAAGTSLTLRRLDVDFDGDATAFLGDLRLDEASFTMVGEQLGGSVLAENGSVLDATGIVDGNLLATSSTIQMTGASAAAADTLDIAGDLSLDADSTLRANVFLDLVGAAEPGIRQSDRLNVAGAAAMGGSLVALYNRDLSPGRLIPARGETLTWRIIDATAGGGTGQFDSVSLVIFDPSSGATSTVVLPVNGTLSTAAVDYTTTFDASGATISLLGVGADPNARIATSCGTVTGAEFNAIVDRLLVVEATGSADASAIATAILLQPDAAVPPAYQATQQRNPYADPDVILDSNMMAGRLAMLRLMQLRDGALGQAASKAADASGGRAPDVAAASAAQRGPGAPFNGPTPDEDARPWMRGYGFYEDIDDDGCADCGYDASIGALMAGADWAIDGGGIVGAFLGVGPGAISYDVDFGTQNENVVQAFAGIFGSVVPGDGALYLQGFLMGGYYGFDRTRTISLPGVGTRTAESENDAWSTSAGGELGLNLEVSERTWLQPFVGVTWGQYWGDGYAETGADSLNLTVQDQSANQWMPTAGARVMHSIVSGRDLISPYIGAAFLGQVPVGGGWAPVYTSDFNLGEATQAGDGPPDRYGVTFQAGIELARITGVTLYAAFDGAVLTGKQRFGGQFGVVVPF
jgi:autotransporter-associated beta strand protein